MVKAFSLRAYNLTVWRARVARHFAVNLLQLKQDCPQNGHCAQVAVVVGGILRRQEKLRRKGDC